MNVRRRRSVLCMVGLLFNYSISWCVVFGLVARWCLCICPPFLRKHTLYTSPSLLPRFSKEHPLLPLMVDYTFLRLIVPLPHFVLDP